MVVVIEARIDKSSLKSTQNTLKRLGRIPQRIPSEVMIRWGSMLVNDMIRSAIWAGITEWKGNLFGGGIKWVQNKNKGQLLMPYYALGLDGAGQIKSRWVSLKPGRNITKWAKDSKKMNMKVRTTKPYQAIKVRTHPFISNGYNLARPKLNMLVKELVRKK